MVKIKALNKTEAQKQRGRKVSVQKAGKEKPEIKVKKPVVNPCKYATIERCYSAHPFVGPHRYNDGDVCGKRKTKSHREKYHHEKAPACDEHPSLNNMPCELFTGSVKHHGTINKLLTGSSGDDFESESNNSDEDAAQSDDDEQEDDASGEDEDETTDEGRINPLPMLAPTVCPVCPEDLHGVNWDVVTERQTGEPAQKHIYRVSVLLGYDWNGERDERFRNAIAHIHERRENEDTATWNTRIAVCRLYLGDLEALMARC